MNNVSVSCVKMAFRFTSYVDRHVINMLIIMPDPHVNMSVHIAYHTSACL